MDKLISEDTLQDLEAMWNRILTGAKQKLMAMEKNLNNLQKTVQSCVAIPFDPKYIPDLTNGIYGLVTREGKDAVLISYNEHAIRALEVSIDGKHYLYHKDGTMLTDKECEDDLFLIRNTPQLSKFEDKLLNEFWRVLEYAAKFQSNPQKYVNECAKSILDAAREQLIKEGYVLEKKLYHECCKAVDPQVRKEVCEKIDEINDEEDLLTI